MPHDSNGRPLAGGDVVTMRFAVKEIYEGGLDCNVIIQSLRPADGPESEEVPYLPIVSCNSRLVTRDDSAAPGV